MRKFFGKQGWNRVLSVVLVMALVAGIVGMYPIMTQANDGGTTSDIITTDDLSSLSANYGLATEDTDEGVKVTYSDGTASNAAFARVGIAGYYLLDEYGVQLKISDIAYSTSEAYSFAVYFGNVSNALYDQDGYMLIYENTGVLSVIASGIKSSPKGAPKVVGPVDVDPLGGSLSLDIKLVDGNYVLDVNGYTHTLAAQYEDDTTQAIADPSKAYFSFAVLDDGLMDSTYNYAATFEGATYTINSIFYNVGGVEVEPSKNMVVNQTSSLTASVFPENVVNKAVTWKSSDDSIVKVDKNGNVTAISEGNVSITATSVADATKSATCEVKVSSTAFQLSSLSTVLSGMTATDTEAGVQLVAPTNAAGWERVHTKSSYSMENGVCIDIDEIQAKDESYSIVVAIGTASNQWYDKSGYMLFCGQSGNIAIIQTPLSGSAPISATVVDSKNVGELGSSLSIAIKKCGSNYSITVNDAELSIENGESVLGSNCYLAFGVMSDIIIADGMASGLYYGSTGTTIGRTDSVSFIIRSISVSPTDVELNQEYINMHAKEAVTLTAEVTPLTSSQNVSWSSADESIATVGTDGTVTAVKAGTTIITAASKANASKVATCVVKVTDPSEYITLANLGGTNKPTVEDVDGGVKVSYTAETDAWKRVETKYDSVTENNYPLKYNGFWPEGNGVHIGFKDVELTNDTDTLAVFIGKRDYSTYTSSWYDTPGGAYMLFYGKDGSFAIVQTYQSWSNNYIKKVFVSEKREPLATTLSLDVKEEDGRYELLVNGKAYSLPAEGDECPIPRTSSKDRLHFAFGLMTGFGVTSAGVMSGPAIKTATKYSSDGTFTITDISYITTEELATANYLQRTSLTNLDGNYVLGKNELATTTSFEVSDFNGTLNDSCEGLMWEIGSVDGGYSIKKAGGDENSYLNISSTGVALGAKQTLTIEHISNTTTSYFTVSDGTNYLNLTENGVSTSTSADKLILYNVRPELAEATAEKPLFTLSTFSDLHSEWIYDSGEQYIRDGIVDATKKVREEDNANVIAFLGDLISDKNGVAGDEVLQHGYWYGQGPENVEKEWQKARDLMYSAAESATESGRALYLAGNHEYAIGGTRANPTFNSGDFTDGIESKLPQLTEKNAYFQKAEDFPQGTAQSIIDAGHVLSYHYNIDGMDIIAINPSYTGAEITKDWSYDLGALDWMEEKLGEIGKDKTVLILGHYPTSSLGDYEAGMPSYNKIKEIFAAYPNVIYLYGHDHNPYIHTDTYQRVQTFAADGVTPFQNRYETPTGYTEAFGGSVAFANDVGLASSDLAGTPAVVQGLLVKVYSDRIVLQMKNYNESPLGVDALREYTIMRDVKLNVAENPQKVEVEEYTTAFKNFRSGEEKKAPVAPKGYVFAGWYYDEACTKPVEKETETVAEDKQIFAKFLPQDVLSVKAQLKLVEGTTDSAEGKTELRLITTIDSKLDYQDVGFRINNKPYKSEYAYTSLKAAGFTKTPDAFNPCSKRFVTRNIINLKWNTTNKPVDRDIKVQAFWTTCDGTTIYGQERIITIKQGLDAIASSGATDYSLR